MIHELIKVIQENPGVPVKFFIGSDKEEIIPHVYSECRISKVEVLDVGVYKEEYYTQEELESSLYDIYSNMLDETLHIMKTISSIIKEVKFNRTIAVFFD